MSAYDFLVVDREIKDIAYQTDKPVEIIHPRVVKYDDQYFVYCNKQRMALEEFIHRLARQETGMSLGGYRKGRGKKIHSTITLSKTMRLQIAPRLQEILDALRVPIAEPLLEDESRDLSKSTGIPRRGTRKPPMSLEQLEERLKKQAAIGVKGEHVAYRHEFSRLTQLGCLNPADHIQHVSPVDVAAGYDLRSEFAGEVRCIEVKSSINRDDTFFVSENERSRLAALGSSAYIYLVRVDEQDEKKSFVMREIRDPFGAGSVISLEPTAWFATLEKGTGASDE